MYESAGACPRKLSKRNITVKDLKPSAAEIQESCQTNNIAQVVYYSNLNERD